MSVKTFSRIAIILTATLTFLVIMALEDTKIHGYRAVQILEVVIEFAAIWAFVKIGNKNRLNHG